MEPPDMKKIVPHLWFNRQASEAAALYTRVITPGRIRWSAQLHNTPSDSIDIISAEIGGREFQLLSAGPEFKFNPSVSFLVGCETAAEVDAIWSELNTGGQALMPLGSYDFSPRYGWTHDRYGLSWQVMAQSAPGLPRILPTQMFVGAVYGRCEEALRFYTSLFPDSSISEVMYYGENEAPDRAGCVRHANFTLLGQPFAAQESNYAHEFGFNEAISYMVYCDTQDEIDHYWQTLSADPTAEACGWLKDRFGFSWQIVFSGMDALLLDTDAVRLARVTESMLRMKKLDIAELERAHRG
jgi:predicted 3-demethylubiquinone-9 3-methyltransferase (glyoxalase superfamily)